MMQQLKTVLMSLVIVCIALTAIPVVAVPLNQVGPATGGGGEQSVDLPAGGWISGGWYVEAILRLMCEIFVMENCHSEAFTAYERCRDWVDQLPTQGPEAHCWDPENGADCCNMKLTDWMIWCELFCDCACWEGGRSSCTWEAFTFEMGCSGSYDDQYANY